MEDVYKFKNPQQLNICVSVVELFQTSDVPTEAVGRISTRRKRVGALHIGLVHMCSGVLLQVRGSRQECPILVCIATGMWQSPVW